MMNKIEDRHRFTANLYELYKLLNNDLFWLSDSDFFEQLDQDVQALPALMWASLTVLKNDLKEYAIEENKLLQVQSKRFERLCNKLNKIDIIGAHVEIEFQGGFLTIPAELFCSVKSNVNSINASIKEYNKHLQGELLLFCDLSIKASVIHRRLLELTNIVPTLNGMAHKREEMKVVVKKYGIADRWFFTEYNDLIKEGFVNRLNHLREAVNVLELNPEHKEAYLLGIYHIKKLDK